MSGVDDWTDARVAQLRDLWARGLSATEIAAAMRGVTRNAVSGKVKRLGLVRTAHFSARPYAERPALTANGTPRLPEIWTAERLEVLTRMRAAGHDGAEIAKALGRPFTRRSVIGKAWRLGLATPKPQPPPKPAPAPARVVAPKRQVFGTALGITPKLVTPWVEQSTYETPRLSEPRAGYCRWPIGDPRSDGFGFCGAASAATYCAEHARRAFTTVSRAPSAAPRERPPERTAMGANWS